MSARRPPMNPFMLTDEQRVALVRWLRFHPNICVGLHGQHRGYGVSPQYLAEELEEGFAERGAYRSVTR